MTKKCCPEKMPLQGLLYGILPHSFCILFVVFSVAGSVFFISLLRPLLLNVSFFYFLVVLSFFAATVSALLYLKRKESLSVKGLMSSKRYLGWLYGITLAVNLFIFMIVFPITANINSGVGLQSAINQTFFAKGVDYSENALLLEVDIPCPGHASLVSLDIRKVVGVESVVFNMPNIFKVEYDPETASQEDILSLEIFDYFPAKQIKINF